MRLYEDEIGSVAEIGEVGLAGGLEIAFARKRGPRRNRPPLLLADEACR